MTLRYRNTIVPLVGASTTYSEAHSGEHGLELRCEILSAIGAARADQREPGAYDLWLDAARRTDEGHMETFARDEPNGGGAIGRFVLDERANRISVGAKVSNEPLELSFREARARPQSSRASHARSR